MWWNRQTPLVKQQRNRYSSQSNCGTQIASDSSVISEEPWCGDHQNRKHWWGNLFPSDFLAERTTRFARIRKSRGYWEFVYKWQFILPETTTQYSWWGSKYVRSLNSPIQSWFTSQGSSASINSKRYQTFPIRVTFEAKALKSHILAAAYRTIAKPKHYHWRVL